MAWRNSKSGPSPGTLALLLLFMQGTAAIRITRVKVPPLLKVGDEGDLDCIWETEKDEMYSIKWYQEGHEFYRYTPSSRDPIQIFDPPTLDVDREGSWGGSVRIANVTLAAEGSFHCEVSADAPTFHTASDTAHIRIVDLPDSNPVIQGMKPQYLPSDWVDLTCISRRSKPAPVLTFRINSELATAGWLEPQENRQDENGLFTSSLRLRFSLLPRLLEEGDVRVLCVAEIDGIYREASEEMLLISPRYQASVREGGAAVGTPPHPCHAGLLALLTLLVSTATQPLL
ncbi:uncharacterized protein LOC125029533 [Penaeus chinensis]|uniref:uncharacterized protein LOC125029533 n=1 Tax=Penaeus chinensis TaxID=139456 RepID=UPI001FB69227|nr:uncharacterized protein LOC125029533 [Penaeus chinensis]